MMRSPGLERTAQVIAENVVSAYERERDGAGFLPTAREGVVTTLVWSLLAVMPTTSSDVLATACNRGLNDAVGAMGPIGPRVVAIDLDDGSVTMRRA